MILGHHTLDFSTYNTKQEISSTLPNTVQKFDIICISETYLDSPVLMIKLLK